MKLHEYQAKELLGRAGLPVPRGRVCAGVEEAVTAAEELGWPVAIKAQVHAGGRGKSGGVRLATDAREAREAAGAILGMRLATAQTGGRELVVRQVLVEEGAAIKDELYLSILPDRATASLVIIASTEGGMDIEEVAGNSPDRIVRVRVDPLLGIQPFHLRRLAFALALSGALFKEFCRLVEKLYALVVDRDLLLAEINPLVVTENEQFLFLDAKVEVDSSALFRHGELADLQDPADMDPLEAEAGKYGLNYIRLEGNIGTMVNGAGLAMATMDLIKQAGGEPANFLDVGGGASAEMIENGFRIILSDSGVKAILINIFGGILRCDVLAEGVVAAARATGLSLPVVVRMEGTNVEKGRGILAASGLELITATSLLDAAGKIAMVVDQERRL